MFVSAVFYMPAPTLIFEWFQAKRGIAAGVVYAGTGIGGATFPFVMQTLLDRIGYRNALIILVRSPS
jgi:MFS family permease